MRTVDLVVKKLVDKYEYTHFEDNYRSKMMLAYCDYIADRISKDLFEDASRDSSYVSVVTTPKMDLHPEGGYFVSTKKTITVLDINGKAYTVTVEEANNA